MKYIKTYERNIKYLFKEGEYAKKFDEMTNKQKDESFYKILRRRKKAQGFLSDANVYLINCVYQKYSRAAGKIRNHEVPERMLRKLTPEEQEEIDTILAAKKYNL